MSDIRAQIAAILDPSSAKDAALVVPSNGEQVDTQGLLAIPTSQGLLVTSNIQKAMFAAHSPNLDTDQVGGLLGYVSPKRETDGTAVESYDGGGNLVHGEVTNRGLLDLALQRAQEMTPEGGRVDVTDALQSLQRRKAKRGNS